MRDLAGAAAAVASSAFGGTAIGATRYLAGGIDPVTLGALRFAGGAICLAAVAALRRETWPRRADLPGVLALGVLFFGGFPVLFNLALAYTTAGRGALALATLPAQTMLVAAALGAEALSWRKAAGVALAMGGVSLALAADLGQAPPGAWRGDLLMAAAALCMALFNVLSRPLIARAAPLTFATAGMALGGCVLAALSLASGRAATLVHLDPAQWLAVLYLVTFGGALVFFLWALALGTTTPTLVAVSIAVNPITAGLFGATLLGEPLRPGLGLGLALALAGIAVALGLWPSRVR